MGDDKVIADLPAQQADLLTSSDDPAELPSTEKLRANGSLVEDTSLTMSTEAFLSSFETAIKTPGVEFPQTTTLFDDLTSTSVSDSPLFDEGEVASSPLIPLAESLQPSQSQPLIEEALIPPTTSASSTNAKLIDFDSAEAVPSSSTEIDTANGIENAQEATKKDETTTKDDKDDPYDPLLNPSPFVNRNAQPESQTQQETTATSPASVTPTITSPTSSLPAIPDSFGSQAPGIDKARLTELLGELQPHKENSNIMSSLIDFEEDVPKPKTTESAIPPPASPISEQVAKPQPAHSPAATAHDFFDPLLNPEQLKEEEAPPPPPPPRKLFFEHFLVVGLPTDASLEKSKMVYDPQILYQYPPDKKLLVPKIGNFCFPEGVKITMARRTASMSSLNEIHYGQSYLHSSENSFVFILTGVDNSYHYGICVTKQELLREAPSFLQKTKPPVVGQRFVSAPRCYCFVSRYPFFSIHFEILYSILAQERLLRLHRDYSANNPHSQSSPALSSTSAEDEDPLIVQPSDDMQIKPTPPPMDDDKPPGWVDAVQILEKYYYTPVPEPGETTKLTLPNGLQTITFACPKGDTEAKLLADWCLGCTFRILSLENIIRLFTGVMLEKQIVFVSKNLGLLSSVVLSLGPLLRPLTWQGLLVPILPANMQDMLMAPVPFIVGVQTVPERLRAHLEAMIVNIDTNEISYPYPITPLPEEKKLQENLRQFHAMIYRPERTNQNPLNISSSQLSVVHSILASVNRFTNWFMESISSHYRACVLGGITDNDQIRESFLKKISPHNRNFVAMFLETQHFCMFIDVILRRAKTPSTSS